MGENPRNGVPVQSYFAAGNAASRNALSSALFRMRSLRRSAGTMMVTPLLSFYGGGDLQIEIRVLKVVTAHSPALSHEPWQLAYM